MGGEKGKKMKKSAMELKERASRATRPGELSFENFEKLVNDVLVP
jgi:hypothetical protein